MTIEQFDRIVKWVMIAAGILYLLAIVAILTSCTPMPPTAQPTATGTPSATVTAGQTSTIVEPSVTPSPTLTPTNQPAYVKPCSIRGDKKCHKEIKP